MSASQKYDYDFIIVGSGFGGSVSALRLSEKGYKVLVIEKGKWYKAEDFPKSNWNLKRWLWMPFVKFYGFFKITFFRHVATLSGVGVGGGSLVYANTLPVPKSAFFKSDTWAHLADWETELMPFYKTALKMMGAVENPELKRGDLALQELADEIGKSETYSRTNVAVFFGEPEVTVPDPYFDGDGPERAGCTLCAGCMIGCRFNAKNTLDKNYLYFAQKNGAEIQAESLVHDVKPINGSNGESGYNVEWKSSTKLFKKKGTFKTRNVIFAGGALGTIKLLLGLKKKSLPDLSGHLGMDIRTNSESLIGITTFDKKNVFSEGVAIGSIVHTDDHSHLEPVRYPAGSGFWRVLMTPLVFGDSIFTRLFKIAKDYILHPWDNLRAYFVSDWAKHTQILLFMQTINSTLRFSKGLFGVKTSLTTGKRPTSFIPEAEDLAHKYAKIVNGKATSLLTETMLGIPTTAHILGGAVMGKDKSEGVIDKNNQVFGYENMYICDGSAISANPGVNPSLTILALSERAMSKIPDKESKAALLKEELVN
ncbi:MAG: GMC family oxidoreductase [Calditrichaeota bacterium]|nr:MAG: GMC family oxidoreductase [Calditrichota bacterium]MBL1204907.1 GMC family oxidoreductase [Calditrichota bacterium]NOG44736.1 GMC family oxidoreductase [Calditrichota bacterium]